MVRYNRNLHQPAPGLAYHPRTWLDNKRVLLVGFAQNADAPPQNVYILDTTKGVNQQVTDLQQVVSIGQPCWDFDNSFDSTKLFVSQCTPGQTQGSSSISVQSATGGTQRTFFTSATLTINAVRVIDPIVCARDDKFLHQQVYIDVWLTNWWQNYYIC